MKPIFQQYHTDENINEFGDCLRAAVASVLELALDDVPHFRWGLYEDDADGSANMWGHLKGWLRGRNIGLIFHTLQAATVEEALRRCMDTNPDSYLLLCGEGAGGQGHVIVIHKGIIVHEPGRAFEPGDPPPLKGPMPTGNFVVLAFEHRPATKPDNQGLLGCGSLDNVEIPEPPDASILDRHERIVLAFSGGKDSLATLAMLRPHWSRLAVVHIDTGDLLPETREVVAHAYHMAKDHVQSWRHVRTNSIGWQDKFGLASDVVTHDCTTMGMALLHGAAGRMQLSTQTACCSANLAMPLASVVTELGATLVIRGTRREDSAWGWLEMGAAAVAPDTFLDEGSGITYWLPLYDWTTAQIFAYLQRENLPIARYYVGEFRHSGPECARCTAWLGEKRGKYLRKFHPAIAGEYHYRLSRVQSAIRPTLDQLHDEIADLVAPQEM